MLHHDKFILFLPGIKIRFKAGITIKGNFLNFKDWNFRSIVSSLEDKFYWKILFSCFEEFQSEKVMQAKNLVNYKAYARVFPQQEAKTKPNNIKKRVENF